MKILSFSILNWKLTSLENICFVGKRSQIDKEGRMRGKSNEKLTYKMYTKVHTKKKV